MARNALYLIFNYALQASLGFAFWIIMAHLFTPEDIGKASSLISATNVISTLALLGLNSALIRFLPTASDRNTLMTFSLVLVAAGGAMISFVYALATPVIAPHLAFIAHSPQLIAGFALLGAGAAANLLTDSIFISSRRAGFCALTDGGVGGVTKIAVGVLLAGTGAFGIFAASTGGFAAAALASLILMFATLGWRPSFRDPFRALKPLLRFSAANFAANLLNLMPVLIVQIIALDRLGATQTAYYFVAFQLALLLYSSAFAVGQAFLAEGSQVGVNRREILARSRRFLIMFYLPACLAMIASAHWVLLFFGERYSRHGSLALILLVAAAVPIAVCNWSWNVLRLAGHLRALVLSCCVYASGIGGAAWFLAPRGLAALSAAWLIGSVLAAALATVAVARLPSVTSVRHAQSAVRGTA